MNTKHFPNSPFQREKAKLGQTQKHFLHFSVAKMFGLSLTYSFPGGFCAYWCLSSPPPRPPASSGRGLLQLEGFGLLLPVPSAVPVPVPLAVPAQPCLSLEPAHRVAGKESQAMMAASSEQEGSGDHQLWGSHPYNPHLPPRATGCL